MNGTPSVVTHDGETVHFESKNPSDGFSIFSRQGVSLPKPDRVSRLQAVFFAITENLCTYIGEDISAREIQALDRAVADLSLKDHSGLVWFRSSGSTGVPKFILHSGTSLIRSAQSMSRALSLPQDGRMLHMFRTDYMSGILNAFVLPWELGMEIYIAPVFNFSTPFILDKFCSTERENVMWVAPNMLKAMTLSTDAARMKNIHSVISATGPLSSLEWERFREKFPTTRLFNTYGSTEQLFHTATSSSAEWEGVGKAIPGVSITVNEAGLISISSETTCLGVLDSNLNFISTSAIETQDKGVWIDTENLEVLGREDDFLSIGGLQVNMASLESQFLDVEDVKDCALHVQGTNSWSEVTLIVEAVDGVDLSQLEETIRNRALELIRHRIRLTFASVPRLANGKLDRQALRISK